MVQVMMNRIRNARMTAIRANNPQFKEYWNGVADALETKMREQYG